MSCFLLFLKAVHNARSQILVEYLVVGGGGGGCSNTTLSGGTGGTSTYGGAGGNGVVLIRYVYSETITIC